MKDKFLEKVKHEVEQLVSSGEKISGKAAYAQTTLGHEWIIDASNWVSRIGQLIIKLYGKSSPYFVQYQKTLETQDFYEAHSNWYSHISTVQGIITGIKHELEEGLLVDFRGIVQADIFADFLEMAVHLLEEGYKDAAAVLIGSVLEDSLRKLAERSGVSTTTDRGKNLTIEPLNVLCAKADVYDKLVQKQITSWGELRNRAAHGEYSKYDADQVKMMLLFAQKFCSDYLGT